jgi:cell division protein FtsX
MGKENTFRYEYAVTLKKSETKENLLEALRQLEGVKQLKLSSNEIMPDR